MLAIEIIPLLVKAYRRLQEPKLNRAERDLDNMFIRIDRERLFLMHLLSPIIIGLSIFLLFHNVVLTVIGALFGVTLPNLVLKIIRSKRRSQLKAQLVDGIMVICSSLKGGLSLIQSIEVMVSEMQPPISQEFGLILRENKMGITLEDSLERMNKRMEIEELRLLINAILVARETGGDLTKVLMRLSNFIRDTQKLNENVQTLTLQGRLQGLIMTALPFFFIAGVTAFNPKHFDILLNSEQGRMLLLVAIVLQVIGMVLLRKFSIVKI